MTASIHCATDSHSAVMRRDCMFAQRVRGALICSVQPPFAVRSSFVPAYAVEVAPPFAISGRVQSSLSETTARGLAQGERAALSLEVRR
jgi:hypothetical protein